MEEKKSESDLLLEKLMSRIPSDQQEEAIRELQKWFELFCSELSSQSTGV